MTIIVTGGAGFIVSNFISDWVTKIDELVINIDLLTYSGNINNFSKIKNNKNLNFVEGDIKEKKFIQSVFNDYNPRAIINFAAETHVDKSISSPENFINTNILGVFNLLESSREYWGNLSENERGNFRFFHISTDEVYGDLKTGEPSFNEKNPYSPNSPYSASKASADHLVRAWNKTYGLPTLISKCSNNYGPYQYPEKLIPLCIINALQHKPIPIYGDGMQIRDWLYVEDHCAAIRKILDKGISGETYNIGGNNEKTNIQIVNKICEILDELKPSSKKYSYKELISYTKDRPGHDRRYSINTSKIENELGWIPRENFESGIRKTIEWYLENKVWLKELMSEEYSNWLESHYK